MGALMTDRAAIHALGQAVYNLPYNEFCAALELEDGLYARDRYADLKKLAGALAPFSDATLARLSEAYAHNTQESHRGN